MLNTEHAAMDGWIAAAEAAADVAGAAMRPFFRAAGEDALAADLKDDRSPVTVADRTAEQAMRAVLAARFPASALWARSSGSRGRARLRWVLDPIDGTRAFITGRADLRDPHCPAGR